MKINVSADKTFLSTIPENPGIYRYYDKNDKLLYIGKARNLKNRVTSYFQKQANTSLRISIMIEQIHSITITITENEKSALLLECNLIKELKPKYNIILRDDKTYPVIRFTNHKYPKIEYYKNKTHLDAKYFGPYPNIKAAKYFIDLLQKIFKIRTCSDVFFRSRNRPCMLYQINRCSAPCVNYINESEYKQQINLAIDFLNGNRKDLLHNLTKIMNKYANNLEFELASQTRDALLLIKSIDDSQSITKHNSSLNTDIIIYKYINHKLYIYTITLRNGMYVGDEHYVIDVSHNTTDELNNESTTYLEVFLQNHYLNLLIPHKISITVDCKFNKDFIYFFTKGLGIKINTQISPQIQKLIVIGNANLQNIIEHENNYITNAINELSILLNNHPINRIECIDISHNQGSNTVAAITVFANGKIDNSQYRRYNLSNIMNSNDVLAIGTIIKRRLAEHRDNLPDVILVDGGRQQFNIVKKVVIEIGLYDKIKVMSLFKGEKRNPLFDNLILDNRSIVKYNSTDAFKLLQNLRDEAHRFAITGHRKKQNKKMVNSQIDDIAGIGAKKKKALLLYFGSVQAIANASRADLMTAPGIGDTLAELIYQHFHK